MGGQVDIAGSANADAATDAPADENSFYRWYVLSLLLLIYIFGAVDRSVVSVIAEPLKHQFQLSDAQIGALGGMAYSVTFALFVLPMGWLIDRVNRRTLLTISVSIWSVLTMCGAISANFIQLVLARMGVGATESVASPASFSLISDIFPVKERSTAVSIYYAGAPAGQLVVFVLGGWLLMHFDWRAVFLVAGVPGLILAALLFLTTKEPVRGVQDAPAKKPQEGPAPSIRQILQMILFDPALRYAMLGNMICTGVGSTLIIWLTSFLVRLHGLPVSEAAIWVGIGFGLSMTVASVIVGPIADRYSKGDPSRLAHIPAVTTALAVFAGLGMAIAPSLTATLVLLVIYSFLAGIYTGPSYSLVLSLARPDIRGSTMATAKLLVIFIGSGIFPVMTGFVSDWVGGEDSIRIAVLATIMLLLPTSFLFVLTSRATRAAGSQGK